MDHHAPAGTCHLLARFRAIECYVFFGAVLLAVAGAIALVTCESQAMVGPKSAQSTSAHHAH